MRRAAGLTILGLAMSVACGEGDAERDGAGGAAASPAAGSSGGSGAGSGAKGAGAGASVPGPAAPELGDDKIPIDGNTEGAPGRAQPRSEVVVREGWRFLRADAIGAEAPGFDDAAWSPVTVPHTYNALDGQDGGGDYYRGPSWYRRRIDVPADLGERRVFLEFGAANAVADVFLGGAALGQHRGGYSAFRFDVTDELVPGENVLAVKVDNGAFQDVPPLRADFTFFGGIYRDVRVIVTDSLHVDLLDSASPGVYLLAENVSAASAALSARVKLKNDGPLDRNGEVHFILLDGAGVEVFRAVTPFSVAPGEASELRASGDLANPHLWDARRDPYLYSARVEVASDGVVTDVVSQAFGIRSFSIDPNLGFILNGVPYDLYGPNRHQDREDKGWAIGRAEHDEDMALIRELGASAVRLAHYQHDQYFYELCDREGLPVWAEIPLVDEITASEAFGANARQQLTELIRQSYNHPSIILWGIGNEQRTNDAPTNELLASLAALAASEDPSRLSTYAHCCNPDTSPLTSHGDVVGYNYYYGWYMGSHTQVGAWADGLHQAQPELRFSLSEYGAGASIAQHEDPPVQPVTTAPFHPEEYQTVLHEATWQQLASRPFIWGKFFWNMFDFGSDGRAEGDALGRNDKGIITYDRQVKKDIFFFYKANWNPEPLVYITSRRFNPRTSESIDVKVYSNQPSVSLEVGGAVLTGEALESNVFRFSGVPLALGDNVVRAVARDGGGVEVVTDTVTWRRE